LGPSRLPVVVFSLTKMQTKKQGPFLFDKSGPVDELGNYRRIS